MILLSKIQATEAKAQSVTPPQPKSMLQAVVKRRAFRTLFGAGPPITPSSGPSIILAPRSCALLKYIIVSVKSAKVAENSQNFISFLSHYLLIDQSVVIKIRSTQVEAIEYKISKIIHPQVLKKKLV